MTDSGPASTGDMSFDDGLGQQQSITTVPQSNIVLLSSKMDWDTNRRARCPYPLSMPLRK